MVEKLDISRQVQSQHIQSKQRGTFWYLTNWAPGRPCPSGGMRDAEAEVRFYQHVQGCRRVTEPCAMGTKHGKESRGRR